MLQTLRIKNYAIIREIEISFGGNLNVITGETGAGKSILIGALGLILGERADTKVLADSNEKCVVEGIFYIASLKQKLTPFFVNNELDFDEQCILRREVSQSGKSRAFINDTPVNLNILKSIGSELVDIVSQHQTLELNETKFQLDVFDAIAETLNLADLFRTKFLAFSQTKKSLEQMLDEETRARKDEHYLRFVLSELQDANLDNTEQSLLEKELELLSNAELIRESASGAWQILGGTEQSLTDSLSELKILLSSSAKHHPGIAEIHKRLDGLISEAKDISSELEKISEQISADPELMQKIEARLDLIYNLQKKHRTSSIEELIELREKIKTDIEKIGSLEIQISEMQEIFSLQKDQMLEAAKDLSAKRKSAILKTEKNVALLLNQVGMPDAQFKVNHNIKSDAEINSDGFDSIEFLFSANKGASVQPLNRVASGGELSRLMLCLKSLISDQVSLPSIVFDEIDSGISGETALKVASVMQKHSLKHQVIAITHLAQIAGKANTHFSVYKHNMGDKTETNIQKLNTEERTLAIAQMLSGINPSQNVMEAAKDLMQGT